MKECLKTAAGRYHRRRSPRRWSLGHVLAGLPESTRFEVPILHLAGTLPGWVGTVYGVVLWAEIYTTAVSSLFGLTTRFVAEGHVQRARWFTIAIGIGALALSQLGFAIW